VLASISVEVDALDPLAVLESIFEEREAHFYLEKPSEGFALAGAEPVLSCSAEGPRRHEVLQAFIDQTLATTIAVGAHAHALGGPLFFTRFAFSAEAEQGAPFESAHVFVPRWQVGVSGGRTVATANLVVEPDKDPLPEAMRIWRAHAKFKAFSYAEDLGVAEPQATVARGGVGHVIPEEVGGAGHYQTAVAKALERIAEGTYDKIVLARAQDLVSERPFHPLRALNSLRESYAECFAFSVANGRGQSFIGASPERLLRVQAGRLLTEALAGSSRRGATASEDAMLGAALLRNEKELREHRCVADSISRRLSGMGLCPEVGERPVLRRLANVQHLHTPIHAALPEGVRLLDVLAALHPTPAVGGSPREKAVPEIRALEGFPRGLYAGALGWLDAHGNGEFCVGLRSALIDGLRTRIYAGAGIVAGSDPAREYAETELKIKAMRDAIA